MTPYGPKAELWVEVRPMLSSKLSADEAERTANVFKALRKSAPEPAVAP